MTTLTRSPTAVQVELDPCGVPSIDADEAIEPTDLGTATAGPSDVLRVSVMRIEPARSDERLAWGSIDGRTILFRIDEASCRDLAGRVAAGDDAAVSVDRDAIIAADLDGLA